MNKIAVIFAILGVTTHLYAGDVEKGQQAAAACGACHGADGNATLGPEYPKLAGQGAQYLAKQLREFKSGERNNAIMAGQAAPLSDEDIANISAYYASLEPQYAAVPAKYIAMGESLYRAGDASQGIPACTACHGPQANGVDAAGFPALGGQNPQYTIAQLKMFRSGERANDNNRMMRDIAAKLTDEQIEALAYYMVGLH
ncbi:MAG: cytochrome c4 [Gammaproteobacteria bacterium]|nr:cytochrome c4 [Gammaproteobacteria bacterium]